jgi:predicted dehydrogenase
LLVLITNKIICFKLTGSIVLKGRNKFMGKVRIGIVGLGNMGRIHASYLDKGEIANAELVAVSDTNPEALKWVEGNLDSEVTTYSDNDQFFQDENIDAVMIATPHYDHPPLAIKAFENDMHVMVEKPAGVYTKQVRKMNEAAQKSGKVFSAMFCIRTNPLFQKARELVKSGELGELKRVNWIVTRFYRPQSYYNSGGWRATWSGEGGGVLLNQAPHQIDLLQWIVGMPEKVRAFCSFGKYHDIEVEDDVTAYLEYENGATGVFITSTGETPGSDRFEIAGDKGKLVIEDGELKFWRLRQSERKFNQEFTGGFGSPENWKCEVPVASSTGSIHAKTTRNWVESITKGTELLAPGEDGMSMVQLANAMHLSTWTDSVIELPVDEDLFYDKLQEQIKNSTFEKESSGETYLNANDSF